MVLLSDSLTASILLEVELVPWQPAPSGMRLSAVRNCENSKRSCKLSAQSSRDGFACDDAGNYETQPDDQHSKRNKTACVDCIDII